MREYHLDDPPFPGLTINVKNDKDCILCEHCTCIWDYTNGPYMFFCDKDRLECSEAKTPEEHTCELFKERDGS
jgi:hypothetical protein